MVQKGTQGPLELPVRLRAHNFPSLEDGVHTTVVRPAALSRKQASCSRRSGVCMRCAVGGGVCVTSCCSLEKSTCWFALRLTSRALILIPPPAAVRPALAGRAVRSLLLSLPLSAFQIKKRNDRLTEISAPPGISFLIMWVSLPQRVLCYLLAKVFKIWIWAHFKVV